MTLAAEWAAVLAAQGITSMMMMRCDFESGPVFIWTGPFSFIPSGTSDTLLNGNQFEPLQDGVPLDVGQNVFSYSGSEALEIKLAVSNPLPDTLALASVQRSEYQSRRFVMWRTVMFQPPTLGTPAQWTFERVRFGSMDEIFIEDGGGKATFTLVVQSHAARISSASQSLWDSQIKFDATDLSQTYVSSSADGHPGHLPDRPPSKNVFDR